MNHEINAKEVLNETFKIIRSKPIILLPMVILVLFSRLQDYLARSYIEIPDNIKSIEDLMPVLPSILAYFIISSILLCIIYAIIEGIYTVTIKNIFENKDVNLGTASGLASKKASLLIAAGLLIGVMISAGTLFLIIPGMYFTIWYFYTIPFLYLFLGSSIAGIVFYRVPIAYYVINIVLDSIIFTWYSVIPVYV